jgi:hypothetical protein
MPTLTSREFNQDVARAKRAASEGPVIITDRGRPAYVLMRHETYQRLAGRGPGIRASLSYPESEEVAFEPPRLGGDPLRPADLEWCICSRPMWYRNSAGRT